MTLEWIGVQLFQLSFAGCLGLAVVLLGEVEGIGEKFGIGAVVAALGIAFGKYFAFRPKTIEANAAARRSDAELMKTQNAELIAQLNKVHQERVDNLLSANKELLLRCEKNEAQLAAGRHTRHLMANALSKVQLRAQRYEIMMEGKVDFGSPLVEIDLEALTAEEDEVGRRTKIEPVVTSQNKLAAENTAAAAAAGDKTTTIITSTTTSP